MGIADRLPPSLVPDDDFAGAIFAFWNAPFKAGIGKGMIFDLDGHAFIVRVNAGSFGNGPAFHYAVEFKPEVVVQAAGPMLLNNEGKRINAGFATFSRFRRARKIALGLIEA